MKYNYVYAFLFMIMSCDPSGNLFITNGYEHEVRVHSIHEYNNSMVDMYSRYRPGESFAVAAQGNIQYNYMVAIRIETIDGTVLAEYSPEYFEQLRKLHVKQKYKYEAWVFTEKGLFLKTDEIDRRYRNWEEILEYYRSDEAVQDLKAMLETGG
jgi:hypothetical protein